ncbi:hypothetical protein BDF20DRAFT_435866 [Mycotypha africana]|uniref:uncharacterized protein n=1 Tax=Mycotypha africana TaxID=64632 RepID=UPI002300CACB|nr:uncharacterized protein BDF20DRAFT_435866 [Mycotypha africana]KAI8981914.1 hypothetical protein BDF20DRAFT_435866 [Mycotypha africana]
MKAFIHFSVLLTNYPGGLARAWTNNSFMKLLFTTSQTSLLSSFSSSATIVNSSTNSTFQLLYAPFPVCFSPSNSGTHALLSNELLYYFLFPFSDERLWQLVLCKLEHFHLGFFLLGSLNNIYFTYKILNDMFDIVLLGQDQQQQQLDDNPINNDNIEPDNITKRMCKILKGFLLVYCCSLVILFWIHFNIFAFHIDSSQSAYTSRQFVAELPLWILRWVTLGIAVVDFTARGIYSWLSRYTMRVDEEDVMSLPENEKPYLFF